MESIRTPNFVMLLWRDLTRTPVISFGARDVTSDPHAPIDFSINVAWPGDGDAPLAAALAQLSQRSDLTSLLSYQAHRGLPPERNRFL